MYLKLIQWDRGSIKLGMVRLYLVYFLLCVCVITVGSLGLSSTSNAPDQAQRKLYIVGLTPDQAVQVRCWLVFLWQGKLFRLLQWFWVCDVQDIWFLRTLFLYIHSFVISFSYRQGGKITLMYADTRAKLLIRVSLIKSSAVPTIPLAPTGYPQPVKPPVLGYSYSHPAHVILSASASLPSSPPAPTILYLQWHLDHIHQDNSHPKCCIYASLPKIDAFGLLPSMPIGVSSYP